MTPKTEKGVGWAKARVSGDRKKLPAREDGVCKAPHAEELSRVKD